MICILKSRENTKERNLDMVRRFNTGKCNPWRRREKNEMKKNIWKITAKKFPKQVKYIKLQIQEVLYIPSRINTKKIIPLVHHSGTRICQEGGGWENLKSREQFKSNGLKCDTFKRTAKRLTADFSQWHDIFKMLNRCSL